MFSVCQEDWQELIEELQAPPLQIFDLFKWTGFLAVFSSQALRWMFSELCWARGWGSGADTSFLLSWFCWNFLGIDYNGRGLLWSWMSDQQRDTQALLENTSSHSCSLSEMLPWLSTLGDGCWQLADQRRTRWKRSARETHTYCQETAKRLRGSTANLSPLFDFPGPHSFSASIRG